MNVLVNIFILCCFLRWRFDSFNLWHYLTKWIRSVQNLWTITRFKLIKSALGCFFFFLPIRINSSTETSIFMITRWDKNQAMGWEDERATCGRWSGEEWLPIVPLDFSLGADTRPTLSIFLVHKRRGCDSRTHTPSHVHANTLPQPSSRPVLRDLLFYHDNISFCSCHSLSGLRWKWWFFQQQQAKGN